MKFDLKNKLEIESLTKKKVKVKTVALNECLEFQVISNYQFSLN